MQHHNKLITDIQNGGEMQTGLRKRRLKTAALKKIS